MRRNILLIDDDKDLQELVKFFLEQSGFIVRCVSDGFAALEELSRNHYDLALLDISMPHINGFKVLRSIRAIEKFKLLPVIMLTGSGDKGDFLKVKDDISDYVIKPPQRIDLLTRVERILGGKPQFEEVVLPADDSLGGGRFEIPIRLVSISNNGIVCHCTVPVVKNFLLQSLSFSLFKTMHLDQDQFVVADCTPTQSGYEYFISFLGMSPVDQEKVRDWILARTFKKNGIVAPKV